MKLFICNYTYKTLHCTESCLHGMKPHPKDECTQLEYCEIVDEEIKCRPLTKGELK